jgi:surface antigen
MADRAIANRNGLRCCGFSGRVSFVAALTVIAVGWSLAAHAQLNLFRGYKGPTLGKEDVDARSSAAQKLLNDDPASVGQTESWVGPKTGNQGTLTIRRVFERSNMPCRSVASEVVYKQTQGKREFTLTACRVANGEWKLAD